MSDNPPAVGHADSIDSRGSDSNATEKKKSRRPANTAFRQQRLKAWQPILTPKTVLPLFFAIGIIFAPIGGLLLYASSTIQEIRLDYTDCWKDAKRNANGTNNTEFSDMPAGNVHTAFKSYANISSSANAQWATTNLTEVYQGVDWNTSICSLKFSLPESMGPPVLLYYHLTKFYQNHRRYVASFSSQQLKGEALDAAAVNKSSCTPLLTNSSGVPYYPCGLIANSLFNDSISNPVLLNTNDDQPSQYNMQNKTDIAWGSDSELYGKTSYKANQVAPPPNWQARYPSGYQSDDELPDLTNPAFMVWMRTAGLPEFSKLSRRNDNETMAGGTYRLDIVDRFPSHTYGGTKSIILTTKTVMGGRNPFLGIAYVVVGGVCIILGAIFTVTHLIKPRKLGDHTYLSWNNTPASKPAAGPSTAMATGRDARPGDVA